MTRNSRFLNISGKLLARLIFPGLLVTLLFTLVSTSIIRAASPTPTPSATPKASPKVSPSPKLPSGTPTPTPTPSLTPSAIPNTNDASTTARLKDRIDRILEEQKQQVKGTTTQLPSDATALIGEVLRTTERTITIKAAGTTETLTIDKTVRIIKARRQVSLEEIAVGDWVIGIGTRSSTEGFLPTQMMVFAQTLRPRPHVTAFGTIKSVNRTKVDIALASDQSIRTFQLDKDTVLEDNAGQSVAATDLDTDLQVLAVGFELNQKLTLKKLRLLVPSKGL